MMQTNKRAKVSDAKKAQIIASLLIGDSVATIAAEQGVSSRTVQRFKRALTADQLQQVNNAIAQNKQNEELEIATLVKLHLTDSLEAGRSIASAARDATWLKQQSATDLAMLYGVMADKAFRILEAAERANLRTAEMEAARLSTINANNDDFEQDLIPVTDMSD